MDADGNLICYDTVIFNETWARMEKIYKTGRAKAIGVSNFSIQKYAALARGHLLNTDHPSQP